MHTVCNYFINYYCVPGQKYQCQDEHALVTENFVVLCPPNEEIIKRSPSVLDGPPSLSPSTTIGMYVSTIKTVTYSHLMPSTIALSMYVL